jgi:hypothetical protein
MVQLVARPAQDDQVARECTRLRTKLAALAAHQVVGHARVVDVHHIDLTRRSNRSDERR